MIIQIERLGGRWSHLLPVAAGWQAKLISKCAVKIAYIAKAGIERDRNNTVVCVHEHRSGVAESAPFQVVGYGAAHQLGKQR